jgi:hypothetical protein
MDGVSCGPDTLKAMCEAFDQAWAEIAGNIGSSQIESARTTLAEVMLSIATEAEDSTDVAMLKARALQAMALYYRLGIRPTGMNRTLRA